MSNTFNTTRLSGQRVLVTGDTQEQHTILSASEWDSVKTNTKVEAMEKSFEAEVEKFFAPLVAASEKMEQVFLDTMPKVDPDRVIVLKEAVKGTPEEPAELLVLSDDSLILKLIDEGKTDRLIWVGSSIEIIESVSGVGAQETLPF